MCKDVCLSACLLEKSARADQVICSKYICLSIGLYAIEVYKLML